jgi:hypothetical protein
VICTTSADFVHSEEFLEEEHKFVEKSGNTVFVAITGAVVLRINRLYIDVATIA